MSVEYCEYCNEHIDTDFNVEHFYDENGIYSEKCIKQQINENE